MPGKGFLMKHIPELIERIAADIGEIQRRLDTLESESCEDLGFMYECNKCGYETFVMSDGSKKD